MNVHKGALAFTSLLLLYALVILVVSFNYGPKARLVPMMVSITMIILGIPLLLNELFHIRIIKRLDDLDPLSIKKDPQRKAEEQAPGRSVLGIILWFFGFFFVLFFLGFHLSIVIFTLFYLRVKGQILWSKAILVALCTWGAIFLMFEVGMKFHLYKGVFFGEIVPSL